MHPTNCQYENIAKELARVMNFKPYYGSFEDMVILSRNDSDTVLEIFVASSTFDIDHFVYDVIGPLWKM